MSNPDEQSSTSEQNGAGQQEPDTSGDPRVGEQVTEGTNPDDLTPTEPGSSAGPVPQDTNASPFQQSSLTDGDAGSERRDVVLNDESIANFADRHRVPVTTIRDLNPDSVDANGNLLANTESLRFE